MSLSVVCPTCNRKLDVPGGMERGMCVCGAVLQFTTPTPGTHTPPPQTKFTATCPKCKTVLNVPEGVTRGKCNCGAVIVFQNSSATPKKPDPPPSRMFTCPKCAREFEALPGMSRGRCECGVILKLADDAAASPTGSRTASPGPPLESPKMAGRMPSTDSLLIVQGGVATPPATPPLSKSGSWGISEPPKVPRRSGLSLGSTDAVGSDVTDGENLDESTFMTTCSNCSLKSVMPPGVTRQWCPGCGAELSAASSGTQVDKLVEGKKCAVCSQHISGAHLSFRERTYHRTCFVCSVCGESVMKACMEKGGKLYCDRDYRIKFSEPCWACKKPLGKTYRALNGHKWHAECLVCTSCRQPLSVVHERSDGYYCPPCWHTVLEVDEILKKCTLCGEAFEPGSELLAANMKSYHPRCFTCRDCGKDIRKEFRTAPDGSLLCIPHFFERHGEKCHHCGQFVTDSVVSFNDAKWHLDCLKCKQCRKTYRDGMTFIHVRGADFFCSDECAMQSSTAGDGDVARPTPDGPVVSVEVKSSAAKPMPIPAAPAAPTGEAGVIDPEKDFLKEEEERLRRRNRYRANKRKEETLKRETVKGKKERRDVKDWTIDSLQGELVRLGQARLRELHAVTESYTSLTNMVYAQLRVLARKRASTPGGGGGGGGSGSDSSSSSEEETSTMKSNKKRLSNSHANLSSSGASARMSELESSRASTASTGGTGTLRAPAGGSRVLGATGGSDVMAPAARRPSQGSADSSSDEEETATMKRKPKGANRAPVPS